MKVMYNFNILPLPYSRAYLLVVRVYLFAKKNGPIRLVLALLITEY